MHVLNGHFEKGKLILDDPVPEGAVDARVKVIVEEQGPCRAFAEILKLAVDSDDLPRDLSENHDKYLYGKLDE